MSKLEEKPETASIQYRISNSHEDQKTPDIHYNHINTTCSIGSILVGHNGQIWVLLFVHVLIYVQSHFNEMNMDIACGYWQNIIRTNRSDTQVFSTNDKKQYCISSKHVL